MSNKKVLIICSVIIVLIIILGIFVVDSELKSSKNIPKRVASDLPLPEVTGGERGKLGIDKNINESNIDDYLGREDSVYRDMRMLEDPGNYEAIGGDSYLSGFISGFEVIPLPYIIPVTNLPEEVGDTYTGKTLFKKDNRGNYVANYEESLIIIEDYFPKDKVIFLMCGGGGYAGMMKDLLVSLGWNKDNIYNIGGYWYYEGGNNYVIKYLNEDGYYEYDFDSVPYHEIDFRNLNPIGNVNLNTGKQIRLESKYYNTKSNIEYDSISYEDPEYDIKKANYINSLLDNNESFVILYYAEAKCGDDYDSIRKRALEFANNYNVYFYDVEYTIFSQTKLFNLVKYAPSVIIINKGSILVYSDAESDEDMILGESYPMFEKWFNSYVSME